MEITPTPRSRFQCVALALAIFLSSSSVTSSAQTVKTSKSDRDIDAIGHRKLLQANGFSLAGEKARGEAYSAAFEKSNSILHDPVIAAYIDRVAQHLAQNSDAQVPITVRIVNASEVSLFVPPGGYQYISSGLLLRLQSEGEMASVIARGIAHTALHTSGREMLRANLVRMLLSPDGRDLPLTPFGSKEWSGKWYPWDLQGNLFFLSFRRVFESEADYFGIQYLYKSGYDTDCFLSAVQNLWGSTRAEEAFSPYPSVPKRLKALHKEIDQILPKRQGAVVSTPDFKEFQDRLRSLIPPAAEAGPKLIRLDLSSN